MLMEQNCFIEPHEAESRRLGMRHQVWRPYFLDLWQRAGIRSGQTVVDAHAGPGFCSFDLADLVGPNGYVVGLERPDRFGKMMDSLARIRSFSNIGVLETDALDYEW